MPPAARRHGEQANRARSPYAPIAQQDGFRETEHCELHVDAKVRGLLLYADVLSGVSTQFQTVQDLAAEFNVNRQYFGRLYKRVMDGGSCIPDARPGRPHKLSQREKKGLVVFLRGNRYATSEEVAERFDLSKSTIRRYTKDLRFQLDYVRWKPKLSDAQKAARVARSQLEVARFLACEANFAEVHLDEVWCYVGGPTKTWREEGEPPEYQKRPKLIGREKVMHLAVVSNIPGRAKIGCWPLEKDRTALRGSKHHKRGCTYKVNREVDAPFFKELLRNFVFPRIREKLPNKRVIVQMDNATAHTAARITQCFVGRTRIFMHPNTQSANSPETNVLDLGVFPWLTRSIRKYAPETRAGVKVAVATAWHQMPDAMVIRTFEHLITVHRDIILQGGDNCYQH